MKKVLFATTALIATAGMASADVTLGGSGRIGLNYNGGLPAGVDKVRFEKRITLNLDGSGETDGGLSFGGRIRLRSNEGDAGLAGAAGNVYIGNDMWRVTVGNTNGAMLNRISYFQGSIGLTGIGYRNMSSNIGGTSGVDRWAVNTYGSNGNAGQVVRVDFNLGDFGVSLSSDFRGSNTVSAVNHEDSLAVSYNIGDWNLAAGYATNVDAGGGVVGIRDMFSASVNGTIGDFGVGIQASDLENTALKIVVHGSYDFGDTTVTAWVADTNWDTAATMAAGLATEENEYGIGFKHSLGGATLAGGIIRDFQGNTNADLGVRFSF